MARVALRQERILRVSPRHRRPLPRRIYTLIEPTPMVEPTAASSSGEARRSATPPTSDRVVLDEMLIALLA